MRDSLGLNRRNALTGSRIRERRSALGLRQGDLARTVGISPSYLNLIEHNKRRIGGKLLLDLARELAVEPAMLSEGADATLFDALQSAATDMPVAPGPGAETDRIDELAGRFPGWTDLVVAQHKRISTLQSVIDGLHDRLTHDPVLAEAMHEVLSSVAAIRSTSDILVRDPDLDAAWRGRFHRNLHEEAERLSRRATAMLAHFESQGQQQGAVSTPQETVEAMFDAAEHHFPAIETAGADAIPDVLAQAAGMEDPATRDLARRCLDRYAADALRLPLGPFLDAAANAGFEPQALLSLGGGDVALVLRRLASLPATGLPGQAPAFGLAVCDGAGALVFRRRIAAFSIPRFGAGCALWPLYRALGRPMVPEQSVLETPAGARFRAWSVCQPRDATGFGGEPVMEATMLLRALPDEAAIAGEAPRAVGPGCQVCPRGDCSARRVVSLVS